MIGLLSLFYNPRNFALIIIAHLR